MKYNTLAITISLILGSQVASANPVGGQVVQGSATFSNPSTNVLNVTNSNNTVINWQSFNIGAGQTTNFIQPSATSSVLNRVVSNNPSQLLGNLNSNGRVFLINQHGILVGEGAHVNTAGFFASTLNITDSDYLNGNLKFEGDGSAGISNQGYIHAGDNGNIVLIAPNIENGGVIEVDNGNVILAAGQSITISSLENPSIQFEVSGNENTVTNLGKILVDQGSASLFAGTLKHSGLIRAGGLVQNADGSISLVAKGSNTINGVVDASGEQGGYIEILGETVTLEAGSDINASGNTAGGEILIGGDQQGLNPAIRNATSTTVAAGAKVSADATENGNGGKVIVFAENDVHVHGEVSARGGASGGNGGFIETSGLKSLDISSVPDASAVNGNGGEWLIDPNNITIYSSTESLITGSPDFTTLGDGAALNVASIESALDLGTNVTISTGTADANSQAGNINIIAGISTTSASDVSLTLNAHDYIIFDTVSVQSDLTFEAIGAGALNIVLNPNTGAGDLDTNAGQVGFSTQGSASGYNINLATNNGSLTINGDSYINGNGALNLLSTSWDILQGTSVSLQGTALNLDATSVLTNSGDLNLDNANITGTTGGQFYNKGNIILNGMSTSSSTIDTANLNFNNYGWIEIGDLNDLTLSGGFLDLQPGAGLNGWGSINSDVVLNGGVIFAGDGTYSFDNLTVNGKLTINSGAVYAILHAVDGGGYASRITVNTVTDGLTINGGELILNWESSSEPLNASNGNQFAILDCIGTGCLDTMAGGFERIAHPITTSGGVEDYGSSFTDTVTYTIGTIDASNIINWTGLSGTNPALWSDGNNWDTGSAPNLNSDVFISATSGIDILGDAFANGIQAEASIMVGAGGKLTLNGNAYIKAPSSVQGGLSIAATNASVTGLGSVYILGSILNLDQGVLAANVVNWGEVRSSIGTPFQIDGTLENKALFALDANSGINTFVGAGRIDNYGVMSWANGASLMLDGLTLSSAGDQAQFQGAGLLTLANGASFALDVAPKFYDEAINWDLDTATLTGIDNIPVLPHVVRLLSGSEIQGVSGFVIPDTTSFSVDGGKITGTNINPLNVVVQSSSIQVVGQALTLNNTSLSIDGGSSLTGVGSVYIDPASALVANGLVSISKIDLVGGTLTANNLSYAGSMLWDAGTVGGSGLTTSGHVDLVSGFLDTDWTITPTGTVNWFSPYNANLYVNGGIITNRGEFTVSSYVDLNAQLGRAAKNLTGTAGGSFINEGLLIIDADAYATDTSGTYGPDEVVFDLDFSNVAGDIAIKSGTFGIVDQTSGNPATLTLDAGSSLQGYGTFNGGVINAAGTVSPGKSDIANSIFKTGTLTITGDFTQQVNGSLVIKMDSTVSGLLHDKLNVGGALDAGGDIRFAIINGKTPTQIALLLDQSFTPLSYGSFANKFATVDVPAGLNFTFSDTGAISISSNSQVLNEIANQLEVLFDTTELNHPQLVRAMRMIDEGVQIITADEEGDEKKRAPRLVCR